MNELVGPRSKGESWYEALALRATSLHGNSPGWSPSDIVLCVSGQARNEVFMLAIAPHMSD